MEFTVSGAILVVKSDNAKIGPISATYVSQSSCDPDCPFLHNGCYAEQNGYNGAGAITNRLNQSTVKSSIKLAQTEAALIDTLTGHRDLRLHVVGDCRTTAAAKILAQATKRFYERSSKRHSQARVFTYTHSWRNIHRAAWGPISVLASCETTEAVQQAQEAGYAAAIVVDQFEQKKAYSLTQGSTTVKVIPCPAQTYADITCHDCRLCMNADRLHAAGLTIAFEAHGAGKKRILYALDMAKC